MSRADIELEAVVGNQVCRLVRDKGRAVARGACNWAVWDRYLRAALVVLSGAVVVMIMVRERMSVEACCMMTRGMGESAARAYDMAAWGKRVSSFQEV